MIVSSDNGLRFDVMEGGQPAVNPSFASPPSVRLYGTVPTAQLALESGDQAGIVTTLDDFSAHQLGDCGIDQDRVLL